MTCQKATAWNEQGHKLGVTGIPSEASSAFRKEKHNIQLMSTYFCNIN